MRRTISQELSVPELRHPLGSREMTLPDALSPLRLFVRINPQDDSRDLSPFGTFRIGVEQAQIDHKVLFVVARQKRLVRSSVGNVW
jgi:hypothetical protein